MAISEFQNEYRFLSNFWPVPVTYNGVTWPSAEHAYQAAKFTDPDKIAKILGNLDPNAAKRIGRSKGIRTDWDSVKVGIMREIVTAKFEQHHMLMDALKSTSPHELIEGNWWGDTFWGVCKGVGENWLGKILMEIRDGSNSYRL